MSILVLSVELIQEIAQKVPSSQKHLRGVCKALDFATAPLFFSSVLLDVHAESLAKSIEYLEALSTNTTPWSRFARTLKIDRLSPTTRLGSENPPGSNTTEPMRALVKFLLPALKSLNNVRSVLWKACADDPDWARDAVLESISSFPVLEELELHGIAFDLDSSTLNQIHGLRKLSIAPTWTVSPWPHLMSAFAQVVAQSPDLTHLQITGGPESFNSSARFTPRSPSLTDIFWKLSAARPLRLTDLRLEGCGLRLDATTLPHLRSLLRLSLYGNPLIYRDPDDSEDDTLLVATTDERCSTLRDIWTTLKAEAIYLTHISTDTVDDSLLTYLTSYSGLKHLMLPYVGSDSEGESNRLAEIFYENVLPRHTQSLRKLCCPAAFEGKWSFGPHNCEVISQCGRLEVLHMSVNSVILPHIADPSREASGPTSGRGRLPNYALATGPGGRNNVVSSISSLDSARNLISVSRTCSLT
ncbi:hypothetical protein C8J57DRAFT_1172538 [Mycena rebaudengoi]|nr:hypothetical protein C8J57DRAFT_1172538 [Mycena rebaudengoi]